MIISSMGDLASSMALRSRGAEMRSNMDRLVQGLSSGRVAARETADGGSFRAVSALQQSLARLGAYESAAIEAAGMAASQQTSLASFQGMASDLSGGLLSAGHLGHVSGVLLHASAAENNLQAAVSGLNSRHAGRYVFSGIDTDQPAMASSGDIIDALVTAVSGATTAAGVATIVDAWFAPGGGFDSVAYGGGAALSPVAVAQGKSVSLETTADDPSIREAMKGLSLAVLIDRPPLQSQPDEQLELARHAGEVLIAGSDQLIDVSARLGFAEERIEDARAEIASESTATSRALSQKVTADPFEYASDLQQVETQLEMLYTLTARASRLKLTDFLR